MNKKTKIFIYLIAALYFAAILFLCFFPFSGSMSFPRTIFGIPSDKIMHFLMFLPFPVVVWGLFKTVNRKSRKRKIIYLLIILFGIIFAALTETAQKYLTHYRHGDMLDLVADAVGIAVGFLILMLIVWKTDRKN